MNEYLSDEYINPAHPPTSPALDIGGGVWTSWTAPWSRPTDETPIVWHWCNRSVIIAERDKLIATGEVDNHLPEWFAPQWVPAGVRGHTLISSRPLHVEPSVFWKYCCGLHGWIRGDKWVSV